MDRSVESTLSALRPAAARLWFVSATRSFSEAALNGALCPGGGRRRRGQAEDRGDGEDQRDGGGHAPGDRERHASRHAIQELRGCTGRGSGVVLTVGGRCGRVRGAIVRVRRVARTDRLVRCAPVRRRTVRSGGVGPVDRLGQGRRRSDASARRALSSVALARTSSASPTWAPISSAQTRWAAWIERSAFRPAGVRATSFARRCPGLSTYAARPSADQQVRHPLDALAGEVEGTGDLGDRHRRVVRGGEDLPAGARLAGRDAPSRRRRR